MKLAYSTGFSYLNLVISKKLICWIPLLLTFWRVNSTRVNMYELKSYLEYVVLSWRNDFLIDWDFLLIIVDKLAADVKLLFMSSCCMITNTIFFNFFLLLLLLLLILLFFKLYSRSASSIALEMFTWYSFLLFSTLFYSNLLSSYIVP